MISAQQQRFFRQFETIVTRTERSNAERHRLGKINFRVSGGVAMAIIIIVMLILNRLNVDITLFNTLGVTALILMIWVHHVVSHPNTRAYLASIHYSNQRIEQFINKLLRASKINIKYTNQPEASTAREHIETLDMFKNLKQPAHYVYYNKLTAMAGNQPFDMYNMSIANQRSQKHKFFMGSLCVKNIDTPEHYYLRITPKILLEDREQGTLNHINTETLQLHEEHSDIILSEQFDIFTNDAERSERILDVAIRPLFETLYDTHALNPININNPDTAAMMQNITKSLKKHRIEMLVIKDQRLYVLFPFRNIQDDRTHPFDITLNQKVNPDALWSDIEDVLEKANILSKITPGTDQQ